MTAAPGPQQPDEVRRFRPHNVPPSAAELREEAVAAWLWEHDHGQFGGHFGEDGEHHARYIDLARDLLDRDELFPAALSAQPDERRRHLLASTVAMWTSNYADHIADYLLTRFPDLELGAPAQSVRDTEEGRR